MFIFSQSHGDSEQNFFYSLQIWPRDSKKKIKIQKFLILLTIFRSRFYPRLKMFRLVLARRPSTDAGSLDLNAEPTMWGHFSKIKRLRKLLFFEKGPHIVGLVFRASDFAWVDRLRAGTSQSIINPSVRHELQGFTSSRVDARAI